MTETWKPVVGFGAGFYEVSDLGRVRRAAPGQNTHVGLVLKPTLHGNGYPGVHFSCDRVRSQKQVHQLVAAAFMGPTPDGFEINHKDLDKLNNRLSNLEFLTGSQNCLHATASGIGRGERNGMAKLTDDEVRVIRLMRERGLTYQAVADAVGKVSKQVVIEICKRRLWRHVV